MNVYDISKSAMSKPEVKLELVEDMDYEMLLRAAREMEDSPQAFDKAIIDKVYSRLCNFGTIIVEQ